jgi:hypothetical protein
MSIFLCFDMENSLLKFAQALWAHFALLLKYDAFIEEDCLEGRTGINSYKSNDYSFFEEIPFQSRLHARLQYEGVSLHLN